MIASARLKGEEVVAEQKGDRKAEQDFSTLPRPGETLADKYDIIDSIGRGAMGQVFVAEHLLLKQKVAIKFLSKATADASTAARFVREAQVMLGLHSEHIVRVFDLGISDRGTPYIVMELLEGCDLAVYRERAGGKLPIEEAVDFVLQACEGIAEAHNRQIVHRDIKPSNLFLTSRSNGTPMVKVLDFGISKFGNSMGGDNPELTESLTLLGSPGYMSPEQLRSSKDVDHRSDIWSLGVVLYNLLAGELPFQGLGLPGICAAIINSPPKPLREKRPEVSEGLEAEINACLEKDASKRVKDVVDLATRLFPFASPIGKVSAERIVNIVGITSHAKRASFAGDRQSDVGARPAMLSEQSAAAVANSTKAALTTDTSASKTSPTKSKNVWFGLTWVVAGVLILGVWWVVRHPTTSNAGLVNDSAASRGSGSSNAPASTSANLTVSPLTTESSSAKASDSAVPTTSALPPATNSATTPKTKPPRIKGRTTGTPNRVAPRSTSNAKPGRLDSNGIPVLDP
jgi:eukaryotic-like serine/threonine-protein kinase